MIKENRENFEKEHGAKRLDFLPRKYFQKYIQDYGSEYDHPLLYRNKENDYFVVSLYGTSTSHERMMEEGFKEIPFMYSTSCRSYMKIFLNTRTSVIRELEP